MDINSKINKRSGEPIIPKESLYGADFEDPRVHQIREAEAYEKYGQPDEEMIKLNNGAN